LGGGLKASFLLENDFNARFDANGPEGVSAAGARGLNFGAFGGEQYLALQGGFGKIAAGAANTPSLTAQASRNPFGTKIGSGFNGVLGTGHVRSNNCCCGLWPQAQRTASSCQRCLACTSKHQLRCFFH
jgi:hypothetical protein